VREELAFAAGLFEGEGSFKFHTSSRRPRAVISMTDLDSLSRFRLAVGMGRITGPYNYTGGKDYYTYQIDGFEKVQALLAMLWPWLGERRQRRGAEVLKQGRRKLTPGRPKR
jgi:hypothetical protein